MSLRARQGGGLHSDERDEEKEGGSDNSRTLVIGVVVLLFLVGVFKHEAIAGAIQMVLDVGRSLGPFATLVICAFTALLNLLIFPTFPMMVGAGVLFTDMYGARWGAVIGTASVFSGLWLSSVGAFCLGRFFFQDFARKELQRREVLRTLNGMIEREGVKIVVLASMSPILPSGLLNYACSLVENLSVRRYAIGCLGLILPVAFWVTSSAQATAIARDGVADSGGGLLMVVINVVIIAALSWVMHRAYTRYKESQDDEMSMRLSEHSHSEGDYLQTELTYTNFEELP